MSAATGPPLLRRWRSPPGVAVPPAHSAQRPWGRGGLARSMPPGDLGWGQAVPRLAPGWAGLTSQGRAAFLQPTLSRWASWLQTRLWKGLAQRGASQTAVECMCTWGQARSAEWRGSLPACCRSLRRSRPFPNQPVPLVCGPRWPESLAPANTREGLWPPSLALWSFCFAAASAGSRRGCGQEGPLLLARKGRTFAPG